MRIAETPVPDVLSIQAEGFVSPAEHRERANVTLEQISESTKISRRFLEAIERGEYEELPGGVFTVSYIRQYAEATGYDCAWLLADWKRKALPEAEPASDLRSNRGAPLWLRYLTFGLF